MENSGTGALCVLCVCVCVCAYVCVRLTGCSNSADDATAVHGISRAFALVTRLTKFALRSGRHPASGATITCAAAEGAKLILAAAIRVHFAVGIQRCFLGYHSLGCEAGLLRC